MKNIKMYYHGGSGNHGCEAIVRATNKILGGNLTLFSSEITEDKQYQIDKIVELKEDKEIRLQPKSLKNLFAAVMHKIRKDDFIYTCFSHAGFFKQVGQGDIYLSIGGDNYCYKGQDILGYYNKRLHDKGAKTVLWGCSFDPKDMTKEISTDLARYDLIVAREKISYDTLKSVNPNTVLLPDPAFQLDAEMLPLPSGFAVGNTIGLNLSPLITEYADGALILDNYRSLIRYIVERTQYQIALIPHVVKPGNDDRTILWKLYREFEESGRVILIDDYNCIQLKGYIARCKMFVGARTHATIAAYSSCVPTLVAGYSVKSIGIARELFGTDENYVLPVQKFTKTDDMTKAFCWLMEHEEEIRTHLASIMPEYKERVLQAKELVEKL